MRTICDQSDTPDEAPRRTEIACLIFGLEGHVDPDLAAALARSIRHYWAGDYEAVTYIVIPKIETAARALLRELDEGIYRLEAQNATGGYPGLWVLLDELKKLDLDPSWAYFLEWLLIEPTGTNLRNHVAHGFITDVGSTYAALTIRAASLVITLVTPPPVDQADVDRDTAVTASEKRDRPTLVALLAHPVQTPRGHPSPDLGGVVHGLVDAATQVTGWTVRNAVTHVGRLADRR